MSKDSSDALEDLRYRREQTRIGGGLKRAKRALDSQAEALQETASVCF